MHVLIVNNSLIPATKYGGTERIIWWLGKELTTKGHKVTYLVQPGSTCDFADVLFYQSNKPLNEQIPPSADLVHLHFATGEQLSKPNLTTIHGNVPFGTHLPVNSVFVSKNHALRHGSTSYVHNGLDFRDYGNPALNNHRKHYHFLAKAAWRVKNVKGAIKIANKSGERLVVLGGSRLNFKMGFRFTPYTTITFKGIIGGEEKHQVLRESKGLIFPVLWNEPFGIAIIESLYFGCPVFGTPYGSLPELVTEDVGILSRSATELAERIKENNFNRSICHDYAREYFGSELMTDRYLALYEKVLNGERLNATNPSLQEEQKEKFLPFFT
jgi:hypothetical protein